ncbi:MULTISPECIES: triose-phosphate isomerase [unclassified Herbaspirillum]|uniref:triose-phosphate isomerase n=1 Tax=unclassified Herbaspirillum TaxID=2624150 RepID=UPI001151D5FB|nr:MULTISPECIES: triose-phosphate isomerase [unclassified Herbaspirillum]MBB5392202.1 triosephosphate isomerase [Herbaspirillum sp. SJZ102]TQK13659.1 triosephosphate isomerase [Herbaspirillum sp. SJZ130]TQK15662.1 triosephosphate isomerase [Herbaspirillum sp. SJZ106]TWC71561.1 triosephosphate isomerase [Herbaspirillum sp. SJZ099]
MRRKLVAGNWKMNGSLAANAALVAGIKEGLPAQACDVAVCVPAPYLAQVQAALAGSAVALGAQDVSAHASGAYTGEVSAAMLNEFGCQYVIIGHSERRAYHGESDAAVAAKTVAALKSGLTPVVCVGETLAQREAGKTNEVVGGQLDVVLEALDAADVARIVVAYEPVWAIGTGKTATPEMAQEVHAMLRARLAAKSVEAAAKVRILYGGSMKPDNAVQLLAMADIDGGLIGGAALKAVDFLAIVQAAA